MGGMSTDHSYRRHCLRCALAIAASAYPAAALAAGVSAGTTIQNTASATYSNGAATDTITSNEVEILVDELLNVAVASQDAGNVALNSSGAVLSFEITNTGNGPEAFRLTPNPALTGDDFDPSVTLVAWDSNNNGVYDAGVDTTIASGGATPAIAADDSLLVFLVTALAGSPADGDTAEVRLTAVASTGSGAAGTKFAGQGAAGGDAIVGSSTASDNDEGTLIASIGAVTLVKSVTIDDQFGGNDAVPGATATYSIVATVSGTGSVSSLVVSDPIPTGTTYEAGSLTLNGTGLTDQTGDDAGQAGSSGISVNLGTIASGASRTITFSVIVN
jgi:uncharacterized repeat protein (TIGR01451 family)